MPSQLSTGMLQLLVLLLVPFSVMVVRFGVRTAAIKL